MGLRAFILGLLCLGWGVTALAASDPLTLGEAMLLALKHNPALAAAGLAVETAEADWPRPGPGSFPPSISTRPTTFPTTPPRSL